MSRRRVVLFLAFLSLSAPVFAQADRPKTTYYVGMGDSVAAGEGALPVTSGYVYDLYDRGVFDPKTRTHFANMALRGARSWDVRDRQVPQVLCATVRPTVITLTVGANDFLRGDLDISSIAGRVADSVNLLLNNDRGTVSVPVLDPVTSLPCRALESVTILVSNYYSIPHPVPAVFNQLDAALRGFDMALRFWLQFVPVPVGSRVVVVDLYTPSLGREGLVLGDVRSGFPGLSDFDIHPTNLGHRFIARQFEKAWRMSRESGLQD